MSDKRPENKLNRRGFLRAGVGTATVAAASVAVPLTEAVAAPASGRQLKARYKESADTKNFYRVNRY